MHKQNSYRTLRPTFRLKLVEKNSYKYDTKAQVFVQSVLLSTRKYKNALNKILPGIPKGTLSLDRLEKYTH